MNSSLERWIRFLDFDLLPDPNDPELKQYDLEPLLQAANAGDWATKKPKSGARLVKRVRHAQFFSVDDQPYVGILFESVDADGFDESYEEISTAKLLANPKPDGYGNRREAHLVIDLTPIKYGNCLRYHAALEESLGLPPSPIASILASHVKRVGKKTVHSSDGPVVCHPILQARGKISHDIFTQLEKMHVDSFTLSKEFEERTGMDEPANLVERRQVLKLDIVGARKPGYLRRLFEQAQSKKEAGGYTSIRLTYEDGEKERSVTFDEFKANAADQLLMKGVKLKLASAMNHDHEAVVSDFATQMAYKIREEFKD